MTALLLDTHTWAWSLACRDRLSAAAAAAIGAADTVLVSPISFFEIAQKVRLGKWPEMEPVVADLPTLLRDQGGSIADLEPAVSVVAGMMAWPPRDPFDRLLAATALHYHLPIVSADSIFDGIVTRVW